MQVSRYRGRVSLSTSVTALYYYNVTADTAHYNIVRAIREESRGSGNTSSEAARAGINVGDRDRPKCAARSNNPFKSYMIIIHTERNNDNCKIRDICDNERLDNDYNL